MVHTARATYTVMTIVSPSLAPSRILARWWPDPVSHRGPGRGTLIVSLVSEERVTRLPQESGFSRSQTLQVVKKREDWFAGTKPSVPRPIHRFPLEFVNGPVQGRGYSEHNAGPTLSDFLTHRVLPWIAPTLIAVLSLPRVEDPLLGEFVLASGHSPSILTPLPGPSMASRSSENPLLPMHSRIALVVPEGTTGTRGQWSMQF